MSKMIRLDKFLAEMGVGTRSEVKLYIKKGYVRVNENTVRTADLRIDTDSDTVTFKDEIVGFVKTEYYMLNKPAGVVSATEDAKDRTVVDLITDRKRKDIFPVGRLVKDTEGLLVLTNDGALAHRLLSPKKHVSKVYYAKISGIVDERDVEVFKKGVVIDETFTAMPANLKILISAEVSEIEVEIFEGKYHQVKRMFEAVGKKVIYLKRLSMGALKLDEKLTTGQYRPLTEEEIESLKNER